MKLIVENWNKFLKEEIAKTIKLKERTIADVAAEQGVVPPPDEELAEMASISQVADDRGVTPEVNERAKALKDWFEEMQFGAAYNLGRADFILDHKVTDQGEAQNVYVLYATPAAAAIVDWPEQLDTDAWNITWNKYRDRDSGAYAIETDILYP
jgi:hypothetical protein